MTTFVDPKFVDIQRQRQPLLISKTKTKTKRERKRQTMALFVDAKAVDILWEVPLEEIPPILGHLPAPEDRHWGGKCSWFGENIHLEIGKKMKIHFGLGKKKHFEIGNKNRKTFWIGKKKVHFELVRKAFQTCFIGVYWAASIVVEIAITFCQQWLNHLQYNYCVRVIFNEYMRVIIINRIIVWGLSSIHQYNWSLSRYCVINSFNLLWSPFVTSLSQVIINTNIAIYTINIM